MNDYIPYLLNFLQYAVYFIFIVLAAHQLLLVTTTEEYRKKIKTKFITKIELEKAKQQQKESKSKAAQLFDEADFKYLNLSKYNMFRRLLLILIISFGGSNLSLMSLMIVLLLYLIFSDVHNRFSLIRFFLKSRIKNIEHEKENELFSLFDILKTEILIDKNKHSFNVYELTYGNLNYFNRIKEPLSTFLSTWAKSPELAIEGFTKSIPIEEAQFIAEFLIKIENMNSTEALHLISEQNQIMSIKRLEKANQRAEVKKNIYYVFFYISAFTIIIWFLWFIYDMSLSSLL